MKDKGTVAMAGDSDLGKWEVSDAIHPGKDAVGK